MENELDKLIICKKCHTLHRKIKLHHGTKARCQLCDTVLYRDHKNLIDKTRHLRTMGYSKDDIANLLNISKPEVEFLEALNRE
jgi:uncharacterized paraquat-inducible protein A